VIDVILASKSIIREIHNWQVMLEDTFSDHRKIQFTVNHDKQPTVRRCHIKRTNCNIYETELQAKVGLWFGKVETPADIERELAKVNSAIISSLEQACPKRKCGGRTKVPWWNHELKLLPSHYKII